ncbi:hypothetical protein BFJ63_vAg204 [Fusarium oxysporum f. sp. narcissi]|uniref:Uncharacterized protein n=1 Tax=Fusarium oxysporum f. sp. narcissi TaxID=451672 RepID=A0A4V1S2W6_FUSOX|nr:hypothetical protein BFJ63_vAg204 [Fusarium oxysporum f. sp. narcissi]
MSSSANQASEALNSKQQRQYQCLCILLQAVNETCKHRSDIRYSSGKSQSDARLTDYQKFICKTAQILDNEKGGDSATALIVAKGLRGPDYVFASNSRKASELERAKSFLSDLLGYVGSNPDELTPKGIQKQVFDRILEFNFLRFDAYLNGLGTALQFCIDNCERSQEPSRFSDMAQLQAIKDKSLFPRDMTSSIDSKKKFFRDCEDLIKAIHNSQNTGINKVFDKHIGITEPEISYQWCQLRHHLGRLHSLRQASEAIIDASTKWPSLFKDFTVNYIPSSRLRRFTRLHGLHASQKDIIEAAFPDHDLSYYEGDIAELRRHGLDEQIQKQELKFPSKTLVHCEANLHGHLVKAGKTRPCDFWNDVMFIATSKPPCRLCYYYFQDGDNDFQVQSSHMNLYPRWRLPDVVDSNDEASIEHREELIEDIFEHLQDSILNVLQEKFPQWKRNDSRTDSRGCTDIREGADSRTPTGGHYMPPSVVDEEGLFYYVAKFLKENPTATSKFKKSTMARIAKSWKPEEALAMDHLNLKLPAIEDGVVLYNYVKDGYKQQL